MQSLVIFICEYSLKSFSFTTTELFRCAESTKIVKFCESFVLARLFPTQGLKDVLIYINVIQH